MFTKKTLREIIIDGLLITLVLLSDFKPFITVITQQDKLVTFSEFKVALQSLEETEKMIQENNSENTVMTHQMPRPKPQANVPTCFTCGKLRHKSPNCQRKFQNYSVNNSISKCCNSNPLNKNIICHAYCKRGHQNTECRNKKKAHFRL